VLFVIAYSVFFTGALVYSLRTLAFLNFSYLATYSLQVGSAIELVIMSIALADRINLLRLEREKAEFSNRMKSEFLAIMSHEIRTPMSGVIGLTSILGKTELKEDQREILHLIQRSGGALMKIINDILDLSRLDADKVLLDESVFDLREIFTDTMDLLKPAAQEKDLGFLLELDASLPAKVKGDPARLRQVLLNLIGNALKFTETGSILIAVKRIYDRDLRILVSISDTGIGIAPEKLEYLFEPFSQVDVSISRNYGGTGLGLAISKKLVNTMGGTIGVESRPGAGSRFFLELPFMEAFESKAASAAPDTEVADGDVLREEIDRDGSEIPLSQKYPQKILVAEDDYVNSMIIQKFLEELGYSTDSVTNGLQALEKAKSNKYTIVFMDVQMPLLDGLEATKILKETLGEQCPVIIATTANATEEDLRRCLASGMDGTLVKPFSIDSLRRILVKSGEG
ncbi:MAG TPA: ATP-binding protein, partial [Leptospiraceae bacterium]|nr:ATP-binding protein [Leptospiraceae bacterium]